MNWRSGLAVALVMAALAGCGDDPAAAPEKKQATTARDRTVTFAECMRENGLSDFPDPDAKGELTIDAVVNGSTFHPDGPEWRQAIAACKDLQPPGFTGRKRKPEEQDASLQFADCMRENGVPDFPDPAEGEPLVDTNRIPSSGTSEGMTRLNGAMEACGGFAEAAGATGP